MRISINRGRIITGVVALHSAVDIAVDGAFRVHMLQKLSSIALTEEAEINIDALVAAKIGGLI